MPRRESTGYRPNIDRPEKRAAVTVVLVADDDADIRDLVAFKLEQAGLDVIAVEDGRAALEQARARRAGSRVRGQ
jgi:DNA-binding NtrC family response regulator